MFIIGFTNRFSGFFDNLSLIGLQKSEGAENFIRHLRYVDFISNILELPLLLLGHVGIAETCWRHEIFLNGAGRHPASQV